MLLSYKQLTFLSVKNLKMVAAGSSVYLQTTWHHILQDSMLHTMG